MPKTYAAQRNNPDVGELKIDVTSSLGIIPIQNATVIITSADHPDLILEKFTTDNSGQTQVIDLPTPPFDYSQEPNEPRPYAEYNIQIDAPGYEPAVIQGTQVLPESLAIQNVQLAPLEISKTPEESIYIPDHTLYGEYPPKIPEAEIKPMNESGEIVLSRVVVPEYIVVHDGLPNNASAPNYWVTFKDYIKNVVSSEIYATWSENTIYANTLAILSFTMNRVYTEWYRNKGYDFTITSSTAYDQKWVNGRNIFENIDRIVDTIFNNYLSRPGVKQPILTSYCDGKRVTCAGLSQWGSKYLGDENYTPIEIIHYYYGSDMYINTAESIAGIPISWPGYDLTIGASGEKVKMIQEQLNRISQNYPAIPKVDADGVYGPNTAESVKVFQKVFNLPQTGVVDFATWYQISNIYVGVSRIAEPDF